MSMTARGHSNLGGEWTAINPFMDNGTFTRVTIEVDNSYNRGYIPPFSLWAPSDYGTSPKYMPFIPSINVTTYTSTTSIDIDNEWHDYFRAGDEVMFLDISGLTSDLVYIGNAGTDEATATLGTNTATISSVSAKDGGAGGTGYTLITLTDTLAGAVAAGAKGTGDIMVLCGSSDSTAIKAYQQAQRVVIMEQAFNFKDPVDGLTAGNGGILVESAVYAYSGRVDYNHIQYYTALNVGGDTAPALTVCTYFTNGTRFNFENIWRG